MRKLKYIAPILIAVACLGLQHAKADNYSLGTGNDPALGGGPFGNVNVTWMTNTTALITFTAASGYLFVDGGSVAVNVNATSWTATAFTSNGDPVTGDVGSRNEDGFGSFNQTGSQQNSSNGATLITFVLTHTSGTWASAANVLTFNGNHWLVAAHVRVAGAQTTGFAAGPNGGTIPDGGTTVMLLGAALGALGMARRFLKS